MITSAFVRDQPVGMQTRDVQTEVQVTKEECIVKTVGNVYYSIGSGQLQCQSNLYAPSAICLGSSTLRKVSKDSSVLMKNNNG